MGKVNSQQHIFESIASRTVCYMSSIAICGGQICPENHIAGFVRGSQVIEQSVNFTSLCKFGLDLIKLRKSAVDATLRRHFRSTGGRESSYGHERNSKNSVIFNIEIEHACAGFQLNRIFGSETKL